MNKTLYVYDTKNISLIKKDLSDFHIISFASILHEYNTPEDLKSEALDFDNSIIDITNLIKDNNFYRIFNERYMLTLVDNFSNIHFCIQSYYLNSFLEMFPYFFNEEEINYTYDTDNTENADNKLPAKKVKMYEPLRLYVYTNTKTIKKLYKDGFAISLSNLIEEFEGIMFKYNLDNIVSTIVEKKIDYIDLTSFYRTLKVRRDLTFQFELLIYQISKNADTKYIIESSLVNDMIEFSPHVFSDESYIDEDSDKIEIADESSKAIEINEVNVLIDQITEKLIGHAVFKSDFKQNYLKFSFLNTMGERKIFSILLSGDSGIGKTEFAKIMSNTLFPNEPLIKISFGNYSTEGVLNSLIGSPLGYIGSEEGGELINKIYMSKSKIILIDEFEKATPGVFNFFYELLEDGKFTDRHGTEHNLDGYFIVFTSNMTQKQFQLQIPDSLKSRFDMLYYFIEIPKTEKVIYIKNTACSLIEKLTKKYNVSVDIEELQSQLDELLQYKNLRDIKKKIEDIVFVEFIKLYKKTVD